MHIDQVKAYLLELQDSICDALAAEDGGAGFIAIGIWTLVKA